MDASEAMKRKYLRKHITEDEMNSEQFADEYFAREEAEKLPKKKIEGSLEYHSGPERDYNPHVDNISRLQKEMEDAPNPMSRAYYQKELESETKKKEKYDQYLRGKK